MQQTDALEWNGDAYHRLSDMQYEHAMELVPTLPLTAKDTVLDAGCGSGRITKEILARLPHGRVIGVDVSASMLETARREVPPKPGQRVEFIQADLQTFRTAEPVDGIFSNMALHFIHDHARLFENFAAMLQPEGWVALQFGQAWEAGESGKPHLLTLMNEGAFSPYLKGTAFDFKGSTAPLTRQNLTNAGFVDVEVTPINTQFGAEHSEKMVEFFNTTVRADCLARLPTEALRQRFLFALDESTTQMFDQPFTYLRATARRAPAH